MELITIIVPIYNVKPYLSRCIESIINQDYKKLEIILVDDGSNDGSSELCDEYVKKDKRIKVIHQKNSGISITRNVATDLAKGKYIAYVDSDDYIELDYISYLYKLIKDNKADISACAHNKHRYIEAVYEKDELYPALLTSKIAFSSWSKLVKTSVMRDNNVYFPDNEIYEDQKWIYNLLNYTNRVAVGSLSKYHYTYRPNSIFNTNTTKNKESLVQRLCEMHEFIKENHSEYSDLSYIRYLRELTYNFLSFARVKELKELRKKMYKLIKKDRNKIILKKEVNLFLRLELLVSYFGWHIFSLYNYILFPVYKG